MKLIKNVCLDGRLTDIGIENGKIAAIGSLEGEGVDFGGAEIYPGLIDTHSHGCVGEDTMGGDISKMARWQLSQGVTTWYPTTTTMSREDIISATMADIDVEGGANVPGFHLEGPFINAKYKGAQNESFILKPDLGLLGECKNVKKISLAPEIEGALDFIKECGIVVSLGHTDTDYDTALKAFDCGATCLTHTYNRMPGIHHREPGPIGAACVHGGVFAEIIIDGKHIHEASVKMLMRIMGEDNVVMISDSMSATGLGDGDYELSGLPVTVRDGYARTMDGALAGSTSTLFDCVRVALSFGIPKKTVIKMASENPARLMGLNKGRIEVGYDADFIIVNDKFELIRSIARGEL
ncbi:MAG: N-acetylglucosamine-6-phosphate deacetylase [Clostridia bacterium]|nr:N-acetylglucosamine-6-phosphate deacetylase [Clostridia bacterium]